MCSSRAITCANVNMGLGTILDVDERHTVIDFDDHGRRASDREQRKHHPHAADGIDHIAHIVPGPQPPPSWSVDR